MKQIKIDEYKNEKKHKRMRKIQMIAIIVIIIGIVITISLYLSNASFRNAFDKYILRKEITTEDVQTIVIDTEESKYICAYDKYIGVLSKNILKLYSDSGNEEKSLDIKIGTPIANTNNRFLIIAQKNEQRIYLINGENIAWQKDLEGEITKVLVNKNGYVAVMIAGTTYKTVITIYNPTGKELFRTYLSTTNAVDMAISNDNKYLAIAEVDTSGTIIQSHIKIISMDKAQTDPPNSVINTYTAQTGDLILNIKYQDRNRLVCMYDTSIHVIEDEEEKELINISSKEDLLADIDLDDNIVKIMKKSTGLFTSESQVQFVNVNNKKESIYTAGGIPKSLHTYGNVIALNLGSEIHFINTNGWIIKKYLSTQEMKDIIMNNSFAGIIYSNKIEIINL